MRIAQSEGHKQTNLPCILLMMLPDWRVPVCPARAHGRTNASGEESRHADANS